MKNPIKPPANAIYPSKNCNFTDLEVGKDLNFADVCFTEEGKTSKYLLLRDGFVESPLKAVGSSSVEFGVRG